MIVILFIQFSPVLVVLMAFNVYVQISCFIHCSLNFLNYICKCKESKNLFLRDLSRSFYMCRFRCWYTNCAKDKLARL